MTSDDSPASDQTRAAAGRRRGLALLAVSALLVTTAACGTDSGSDEPTASDPTTSATPSTSGSPSESHTTSTAPPTSDPTTESGDPVPSPIINKGVKAALKDDFPALVPAGVPAGWTVEGADYTAQDGGWWQIHMTAPSGGSVDVWQTVLPMRKLLLKGLGHAPEPSGTVDLGEYGTGTWNVYPAEAVSKVIGLGTRIAGTSALVIGNNQDELVEIASQLLTAEDGGSGTGDG